MNQHKNNSKFWMKSAHVMHRMTVKAYALSGAICTVGIRPGGSVSLEVSL